MTVVRRTCFKETCSIYWTDPIHGKCHSVLPSVRTCIWACKHSKEIDYSMGSHKLEVVDKEKDVGVHFVNNLKPSKQCQPAYPKANKVLGMIGRTISHKDLWFRSLKSGATLSVSLVTTIISRTVDC